MRRHAPVDQQDIVTQQRDVCETLRSERIRSASLIQVLELVIDALQLLLICVLRIEDAGDSATKLPSGEGPEREQRDEQNDRNVARD